MFLSCPMYCTLSLTMGLCTPCQLRKLHQRNRFFFSGVMTPTLLPVKPSLHLTDVGLLCVCHCQWTSGQKLTPEMCPTVDDGIHGPKCQIHLKNDVSNEYRLRRNDYKRNSLIDSETIDVRNKNNRSYCCGTCYFKKHSVPKRLQWSQVLSSHRG